MSSKKFFFETFGLVFYVIVSRCVDQCQHAIYDILHHLKIGFTLNLSIETIKFKV